MSHRDLTGQADEELVAALRTDPAALEEFYRRHVRGLTRYAARRMRDPSEAADLIAAAFLEAVESSARYDPRRGRPIAWLTGIAANLAAVQERREAAAARALARVDGQRPLEPDDFDRLERQIDAARRVHRARAALDRLSPVEREMLELVGQEGLLPGEAARLLGISPVAARMRLARARKKARQALEHGAHPRQIVVSEEA
jgi:RNA polymerase sigma-70 factor (ECF subfamily)